MISVYAEEKPSTQQPLIGFDSNGILDNESYPHHESLPLTARSSDRLIYIISGVISAVLLLVLVVVVAP